MTTATPTTTALDSDRLAEFGRTLRAMLRDQVLPLAGDERSVARHQAHTQSLADALARMADGTFGQCRRCAGSIPLERLEVVPTATACRACAGPAR